MAKEMNKWLEIKIESGTFYRDYRASGDSPRWRVGPFFGLRQKVSLFYFILLFNKGGGS